MMLRLVLHVLDQRVLLSRRMRERAVAFLPALERLKDAAILDPLGRGYFDVLHKISQRHGWMETAENVNVILDAADSVKMTFLVLCDAPNVTKQIFATRCIQRALTIFRREHDVIKDLCVGGHFVCCSTPPGLNPSFLRCP